MAVNYDPEDKWVKRAKEAGFRARSVFKLAELDQRFKLIRLGDKVLDLAAAPGSFAQYASKKVGFKGQVLGLDIKPIKQVAENVTTKVCNITKPEEVDQAIQSLNWQQVDVILSDAAPNISGIKYVDQMRSLELNQAVFAIAQKHLKPQGKLVIKAFEGEGTADFIKLLKRYFYSVKAFKTAASRDTSREVYLIAKGKVPQ